MRIDLGGKTALVTGSTAGIGEGIAMGLVAAGASVVVNGRSQKRVDAVCERIDAATGAHDRVRGVVADVATADGCRELIESAPDIDILVNNVGVYLPTPVFEATDEDWLGPFEVNVMSGVRLCRHHVPRMVERGWGRVIFISSESALHVPDT